MMSIYVAFLRAVNVAGHGILKMTALQEAFLKAGGRNARTFIQSGNVVFESTPRNVRTVVRKVGEQIRSMLGAEAQILLRTGDEIAEILRVAPFKHLQGDPSVKLSVVFLFANAGKQPK
jgi:uncharacterized protein (DUF1697 family)